MGGQEAFWGFLAAFFVWLCKVEIAKKWYEMGILTVFPVF